jgi:hypothetical protein
MTSRSGVEKHRVWLNLTNSEGAFKQALVGYIAGATNDYDYQYDGRTFNANKYVDFYSVNLDKNLTIQGRALPFNNTDSVPLGYKSTIDGDFTINIDYADGLLVNQPVFLEDKTTNVIHNLKNGRYAFATLKGVFNDRFVLRYVDKTTVEEKGPIVAVDPIKEVGAVVGEPDINKDGKAVIVFVKNHQVKIDSFDEIIDKVVVYGLRGRVLYEKENVNRNEFSIQNLNSADQFLIVQVLLKNGTWVNEKIIFKGN